MNIAFISELGTIIPNLKEKGDVPYGRITKAATQLLLCFYYLKFIDYEVLFIVFVFFVLTLVFCSISMEDYCRQDSSGSLLWHHGSEWHVWLSGVRLLF